MRLEEREHHRWVGVMEKSSGSLEVYKEVVEKRGEIDRWDGIPEGVRVWWRPFRGEC